MIFLVISSILIASVYFTISWLVPKLMTWFFHFKYQINVNIGHISFPSLVFYNVIIEKNECVITAKKIHIRSSLFTSDVKKLLSLIVKELIIQINLKRRLSGFDINGNSSSTAKSKQWLLNSIVSFLQLMSISIEKVQVKTDEILFGAGCYFVVNGTNLVLDGNSLFQNSPTIAIIAKQLKFDLWSLNKPRVSLFQIQFVLNFDLILQQKNPSLIQKLFLQIQHTEIVVNEDLLLLYNLKNCLKSDSIGADYQYTHNTDLIPKCSVILFEDVTLKCIRSNSSVELFKVSLKSFNASFDSFNIDEFVINFDLDSLIWNNEARTINLDQLLFNVKAEKSILNVFFNINTLCMSDNELQIEEILTVIDTLWNEKSSTNQKHNKLIESILKKYILNAVIEFWNLSVIHKISNKTSNAGFNHFKITLEQSTDIRGFRNESFWSRLLFMDRYWSVELFLESFWCTCHPLNLTECQKTMKKQHYSDTPVFIGITLVRFGSLNVLSNENVDTTVIKLEIMLDSLQVEINENLVMMLQPFIRRISSRSTKSSNSSLYISMAIANFNIFILTPQNANLTIRIDSMTVENSKLMKKMQVNVVDVKMYDLVSTNKFYKCLRSDEIQSYYNHIRSLTFDCNETELILQFVEDFHLNWSTNFHLKMLTIYQMLLFTDLDNLIDTVEKRRDRTETYFIQTNGLNNTLHITISEKHEMNLIFDGISVMVTDKFFHFEVTHIRVSIDDDFDVFDVTGLCWKNLEFDHGIQVERENTENFLIDWNHRTWLISIDVFKAIFPYEHNFADSIHNELLSVAKWLKLNYRETFNKSKKSTVLPPDLVIIVREFLFEMSDDPFEIRLRDNYELLEDEFKENLKRKAMLDVKIEEFLKAHLHLPVSKIDELYANLTKKNAEIYVQRSKQMYLAVPARTRLFAWSITDLKLLLMIDPSILGKDNEIQLMRRIDTDSPWPDDGLEFSTLWARAVWLDCSDLRFELRDFPQPLLVLNKIRLWGFLVGAEELPPKRAKRTVEIDLGPPWGIVTLDRNMSSLKFYHDFNCKIDYFSYAFGPCWEPVIVQCHLSFEKILSKSKDPSKQLPFWDKLRLLFHGRLTTCVKKLTILLHASLDPYNTTEEMELTWSNIDLDWINMKIVLKGDLDILVRTASKYDDCRLLHLPNVRVTLKLQWICLGDQNDHHSVFQCAPDKLPEYSSNQEHDSFRAFRSQNLNVTVALETRVSSKQNDYPTLLLYGSTLRWIEKLKLILSGVTRPTRRGTVFNNIKPRKTQLSRHYKKIRLLVDLHKFQIFYWMSFAMQRGFELIGDRLSLNSEHILNLVSILDGLKHRPKAEWSIVYMNCELNNAELWLKSSMLHDNSMENTMSLRQPVEKYYFLSVSKVSYGRETLTKLHRISVKSDKGSINIDRESTEKDDTPTHRLVVHNLKGAWTKNNRNVVLALYDSFLKIQQLKKNLSKDSLKAFKGEINQLNTSIGCKKLPEAVTSKITVKTKDRPFDQNQSGQAAAMLQRLIAEIDSKSVVFSDDLSSSSSNTTYQQLQGLLACQQDDVLYKNWSITLVNSQVVLKGWETKGYVILSAAKAEILQRIHKPVWKECTLVSKTTWVGSLESMQYYATVNAGKNDLFDENIMWLTINNIQEKDSTIIEDFPDLPHLVGSGQSVGGVVSETVGGTSIGQEDQPVQLQRIVSRCKCEFFYASYGTINVDFEDKIEVPPPPEEDLGPWEKKETAIDAFTLMHHDLDVCTNSLQYAMILDVVNNLLLYVEPRKKEALERLARMRFRQQLLHSFEDQRKPIQNLQNEVRVLIIKLKRLEKETYLVNKALIEDSSSPELLEQMEELEKSVYQCKEELNAKSEELGMMVSCYKESQLLASSRRSTKHNNKPTITVKVYEICFKRAQWRLTEADGQLGIADLVLSNFLYTKTSKSDDSVEHLLELGYLRMTNLLPNQIYKEVLCPTEIQSSMPVDHKKILRIFCREKPPVGGISVKDHFEVNIMPITIGLTKKFYNTMLKFCFPERDPENIDADSEDIEYSNRKGMHHVSSKLRDTNFYVNITNQYQKDVEKMKERAEKNKLFIYIKIPEVPARVSYKGNKEKNLQDIRDFSLVIPTLEYHNVTWTWLDLFLAMKSDTRRVLVSQAIRQKLKIKRSRSSLMISKLTTNVTGDNDDDNDEKSLQEEQKAKMLFGSKIIMKNESILSKKLKK